jgi:hypothetical protein
MLGLALEMDPVDARRDAGWLGFEENGLGLDQSDLFMMALHQVSSVLRAIYVEVKDGALELFGQIGNGRGVMPRK